jgi:hypothetical protein
MDVESGELKEGQDQDFQRRSAKMKRVLIAQSAVPYLLIVQDQYKTAS